MADVKWIKLYTNLFDNRKIKQIRKLPEGDALIGVWVQILCLAGQINDSGMVYFSKDIPYTDEMLSTEFDRPINIIRLSLATLQKFKMIDIVDNVLLVSNWEKYQSADKLEKMKEQNRIRQQKFRDSQPLISKSNVTVTLPVTVSNATDIDIERDKDIDKEKDKKSIGEKEKRFSPPTLEEIKNYCKERENTIDAEQFIDFYTSKNWYVGKTKMKDWKAAVRTWEKREAEKGKPIIKKNAFTNYEQRDYDFSDYEKQERERRKKYLEGD